MPHVREAITEGYKALKQAFHRGDAESIAPLYTEDAELHWKIHRDIFNWDVPPAKV